MSHLPPFRTRRDPTIEPHFGEAADDTPAQAPASRPAAPQRQEPAFSEPRHAVASEEPDDDDAVPMLTQLVQVGAPAAPLAASPQAPDEELVMRITDEVLDALQPALEKLVSDAVRKSLQQSR